MNRCPYRSLFLIIIYFLRTYVYMSRLFLCMCMRVCMCACAYIFHKRIK